MVLAALKRWTIKADDCRGTRRSDNIFLSSPQSNESTSWKVQIPCERLRPLHRLVASFNESAGTSRSLKLASLTDTTVPAASFRLTLENVQKTVNVVGGTQYQYNNRNNKPPFFFTAVAWVILKKSKEDNASKTTLQTTTKLPVTTATSTESPLCSHAIVVNETMSLQTELACQSTQWRVKFAQSIRVLKIISVVNLKEFSISTQKHTRLICSTATSRCPKVTFVSEAVILWINRSVTGSAGVLVQLVPDDSMRCSSLNKKSEEVGLFEPQRKLYKVGDSISFICPPGFSLPNEHRSKRKCTVQLTGKTEWSDVNRPSKFDFHRAYG